MSNPTFTLTATDGSKITLMLAFDTVPFPCVMIHEFRDGQWLGGPSYGNWFQGDVNPVLAEMNLIGMKAWIRKYVCSWVKSALIGTYGNRVAKGSPPPTPPMPAGEITLANAPAMFEAAMAGAVWTDTDGDGLPELVIP